MDNLSLIIAIPLLLELICMISLMVIFITKWEPSEQLKNLPLVTIFMPFYNEDRNLIIEALNKIDSQDYPHEIQVIIIDDGSTNHTPIYVDTWLSQSRSHNFKIIKKPKNSGRKGAALDFALENGEAKGEIYIVVDSDTFIEKDGIKNLANKIWSNPKYAAVCGYIVPKNHADNLLCKSQFYEHLGVHGALRTSQDQLGVVPVLAGAFVAHRASVVKEIGGWSEWLVEDISWCWKALANRYKTGYTSEAKATTQCPESKDALFRQRRRWSRGRVEALSEAWKVSPTMGVISLPWFVISAIEFLFPPMLLAIPIFIWFDLWAPLILTIITIFIEAIFITAFIRKTGNTHQLTTIEMVLLPMFTHLLKLITWVPNILGYFDEIARRDKKWLTR
ncbi:glycosyltransferase family 2 protein [Vibrio cionasavignyae]|uniref:glycosyltransferase family 2 protein n=1 Tax=Vibrio cionasavignyae TaxID=2910252 RepID=UPI003D10E21E